jgi:hypothetical protein
MKQLLFGRRLVGASALVAALFALPVSAASATAPAAQTLCAEPAISQAFLSLKDSNWYTLAPGQDSAGFTAGGWTLSGGARIVAATLPDGSISQVLDLPAGSSATSPAMCVDGNYPMARMQTRTLGRTPDNSARFSVLLAGGRAASPGAPVQGTASWAVTPPTHLAKAHNGAEQVQFSFTAGTQAADLQVYGLFIDPRMCH